MLDKNKNKNIIIYFALKARNIMLELGIEKKKLQPSSFRLSFDCFNIFNFAAYTKAWW